MAYALLKTAGLAYIPVHLTVRKICYISKNPIVIYVFNQNHCQLFHQRDKKTALTPELLITL